MCLFDAVWKLGMKKLPPPSGSLGDVTRRRRTRRTDGTLQQPLAAGGGRCGGRYDGWVNNPFPPPSEMKGFFIRPALFLGGYGGESATIGRGV